MPWGHRRRSSITSKVGALIRALRELRGLGQVEFARRIGTSPSDVHRLEVGSKAATIVTLAGELFVDDAPHAREPAPDRLWLRLVRELPGKDREYLRSVEAVMRTLDRVTERRARGGS